MRHFTPAALAFGLCLAFGHAARADEEPSASQAATIVIEQPLTGATGTLTFNPLSLLIGHVELQYEQALTPSVSVFVGPQAFWLKAANVAEGSGLGATGGLRYFVLGSAPEGFFISPYVDVGYASWHVGTAGRSGVRTGAGGQLGYTWIHGSVAVSVAGGLYYAHLAGEDPKNDWVRPSLRLAIGPSF